MQWKPSLLSFLDVGRRCSIVDIWMHKMLSMAYIQNLNQKVYFNDILTCPPKQRSAWLLMLLAVIHLMTVLKVV